MATRGRPRKFDETEALDRAVEVFWRQGYDGTSIADLTAAMQINPPSLYGAFGSKRELFQRAVDRYMESRASNLEDALSAPSAREATWAVLMNFVRDGTLPGLPAGCLMVQGALTCSDENRDVALEMARRRNGTRIALQGRFEEAVKSGEFPLDTDPAALSLYAATVAVGISVQAASGASRSELIAVAELAMLSIPGVATLPLPQLVEAALA
ncbi:TetR/AcrR family transcriptional regulator [Streptomyces mirabilis]